MKYVSVKKVRQIFDAGFSHVENSIKTAPKKFEKEKKHLEKLVDFRKSKVHWATTDGEYVVPLEDGDPKDAWLVAYPKTDKYVQEDAIGPLWVDGYSDQYYLHIVPHNIDPVWAGPLLFHELSHLYDKMLNLSEPTIEKWLQNEARAYEYEYSAMEILSTGRFKKALQELLPEMEAQNPKPFESPKSLIQLLEGYDKSSTDYFLEQMETATGLGKSKSNDDRGMRKCFLIFAFMKTRLADYNLEDEEKNQSYLRSIKYLCDQGWDGDLSAPVSELKF
jgi:hypothetical protein